MRKIAVVDYGAGNIGSVVQAFRYLGEQVEPCASPEQLANYSHLVLPGVGSFGYGMAQLRRNALDQTLRRHIAAGKPLLGICLGMQLLFDASTEYGTTAGLRLLSGKVVALAETFPRVTQSPNTGWMRVETDARSPFHPDDGEAHEFYFNHSYICIPEDMGIVRGTAANGRIVAIVECDNLFAVQFHPEKSHLAGLQLLKKFTDQG